MANHKETVSFTKMHGAGNDYIFIDCMERCPQDLPALSIEMSDRHFGVGADGIILILPSEIADFRMRMFNADGSEGKMCGNATRCIGKFVYEKGYTDKRVVTLETLGGVKIINLTVNENNEVTAATVDMGEPILAADKVPVISDMETVVEMPVETSYGTYRITAVSMGNPHGVIFVDDLDSVDVHGAGRELEHHAMFPERANIEFAQVLNSGEIKMRVWERGSGETMACGTGASATAVAAALTGRASREVKIHLLGGILEIKWNNDGHVFMTGPAETSFEGIYVRKG